LSSLAYDTNEQNMSSFMSCRVVFDLDSQCRHMSPAAGDRKPSFACFYLADDVGDDV